MLVYPCMSRLYGRVILPVVILLVINPVGLVGGAEVAHGCLPC